MSKLIGKAIMATATMDQLPSDSRIIAQSPLADKAPYIFASTEVKVVEIPLVGQLLLRGKADHLDKMVHKFFGINLPKTLSSFSKDNVSILWLGPDEWLILLPGQQVFATEMALREKLKGHYALTNVSGGQTLIEVCGLKAQEVLAKSTVYDLDEKQFPVGKVVGSVFAKAQAYFYRQGKQTWHLIVRRSFANYIADWLADAGYEYQDSNNR